MKTISKIKLSDDNLSAIASLIAEYVKDKLADKVDFENEIEMANPVEGFQSVVVQVSASRETIKEGTMGNYGRMEEPEDPEYYYTISNISPIFCIDDTDEECEVETSTTRFAERIQTILNN